MNEIIERKLRQNPPAIRFLYKSFITRSLSYEKAPVMGKAIWLLLYSSLRLFFYLRDKKHQFISWITQYFPFSLMFQRSWYHANLQPVRQFMDKLERVAKLTGKHIILLDSKVYEGEMEFIGRFNYRVTNKPAARRSLEKVLQKKFGNIYVREHQYGFRIIFPYEMIFRD